MCCPRCAGAAFGDYTAVVISRGSRSWPSLTADDSSAQSDSKTEDASQRLSGDANGMLPAVYDELKQLAAAKLAGERPDHTLSATALVHEAYLKFSSQQRFENRGHFLAAAAEAMRRILINHARDRKRLKRGGGRIRLELLDQADSICEDPGLVLTLDDSLERLAQQDLTAAQVAQLHLLGGLSVEQAAQVVGISRAGAYREWKYARAWLRDVLSQKDSKYS